MRSPQGAGRLIGLILLAAHFVLGFQPLSGDDADHMRGRHQSGHGIRKIVARPIGKQARLAQGFTGCFLPGQMQARDKQDL